MNLLTDDEWSAAAGAAALRAQTSSWPACPDDAASAGAVQITRLSVAPFPSMRIFFMSKFAMINQLRNPVGAITRPVVSPRRERTAGHVWRPPIGLDSSQLEVLRLEGQAAPASSRRRIGQQIHRWSVSILYSSGLLHTKARFRLWFSVISCERDWCHQFDGNNIISKYMICSHLSNTIQQVAAALPSSLRVCTRVNGQIHGPLGAIWKTYPETLN